MSRYKNTKIKTDSRGKGKYLTTIYYVAPKSNNDVLVMSQDGDRFDLLATEYYGDPSLWWYIAKANNMKFNNIPVGTVLRIPASVESAQGK